MKTRILQCIKSPRINCANLCTKLLKTDQFQSSWIDSCRHPQDKLSHQFSCIVDIIFLSTNHFVRILNMTVDNESSSAPSGRCYISTHFSSSDLLEFI